MGNVSQFIGLTVKLFLLLTPFFILSLFIATTEGMATKARKALAFRVGLAVTVISLIIFLFGEMIFRYLGITLEAFRIVTLRPKEGTLLNITCWIPESKVRPGDKLVIEYNPCNFGRYDFMQTKVRSLPMELKLPGAVKKVEPVMI